MAKIRVLYGDTDQMGVVYNAIYLRWFEVGARRVAARGTAAPTRISRTPGIMLPVVEAHVRYREPARYDDLLDVARRPDGDARCVAEFTIELRRERDGKLLVRRLDHARLHLTTTGKSRRFPDELLLSTDFRTRDKGARTMEDRNLALEVVRVTEAAALSCARWMGRGDAKGADQAAVDAMRRAFDACASAARS